MENLQERFVCFATNVFQHSAPLMENNFLEPRVKKLISSSSKLGACLYNAMACRDDYEFTVKVRASIIELQETQYWIQILLNAKPGHLQLMNLAEEAKNLLQMLNGLEVARMAV